MRSGGRRRRGRRPGGGRRGRAGGGGRGGGLPDQDGADVGRRAGRRHAGVRGRALPGVPAAEGCCRGSMGIQGRGGVGRMGRCHHGPPRDVLRRLCRPASRLGSRTWAGHPGERVSRYRPQRLYGKLGAGWGSSGSGLSAHAAADRPGLCVPGACTIPSGFGLGRIPLTSTCCVVGVNLFTIYY